MIEARGLVRRFGELEAVAGLSFQVAAGEIFGFIGPNGAGKTTTIRILATLDLPSAGVARIAGHDVAAEPDRVREALGYMPDAWGVYPGQTVRECLDFFAAAHRIPRRERGRAVGEVMELTDLTGLAARRVEALSKGMQQRLCLATTLVHDPRLLILDEPANGLDPGARIEFREILRELRALGKTILISSHILTELSDLVTAVGIVERGRMVMSGPVGEIQARLAGAGSDAPAGVELRRVLLRTRADRRDAARDLLLARPEVREASPVGERELRLLVAGPEEVAAELVRALVAGEVPVLGLAEEALDLERVFLAVTRGQVQ